MTRSAGLFQASQGVQDHGKHTETATAVVPLLELKDVAIAYEESNQPTVSNVSLVIRRGESTLFLGPSGCGKSTLAMLCAGLIPSAVEAEVSGTVNRHPSISEPGTVGYVFQDADSQFCMLQAADEIAFGLENTQLPRVEMAARIRSGLDAVGLQIGLNDEHAKFSGGMKQKLAVACAIAMESQLLVLDEPTANLDPMATRQVFDTIGELHRRGRTMIVIEHKFDLLLQHMDRVVLFDAAGRIHREGPTRAVLREEWPWLVSVGVVPRWKTMPALLNEDTFGEGNHHGQIAPAQFGPRINARALERHQTCSDTALDIHGGRLEFDGRVVWRNLSLTIPKGSFTAIVGPNGAGKSSLLHVFAGMQKLTEGRVTVLGRDNRNWSRRELVKALAFCFQNPEMQFIYERVGDELANRIVGDEVPDDVRTLLTQFGLEACAPQSPFALSQGQKRRLSVAAMMRDNHELYLFDEPTFGQDAGTQEAIMERMLALHNQGKTIVITTHDMDLVSRFATHVVVITDGGLAYFGRPGELFERQDVMRRAHLVDDVAMDAGLDHTVDPVAYRCAVGAHDHQARIAARPKSTSYASGLNPAYHLIAMMAAMFVAIFANTIPQAIATFALPVFLMLTMARMTPWKIITRLSPFLTFYVLYVVTFAGFSAVSPGTKTVDVLWFHFSLPGLYNGLILAFRMLGAVSFGILFISSTDITDLVVSLCKAFRIPPKFVYGSLAGIRFLPLFQAEWQKLKLARQLRGRDAKWGVLRPVTYALPLLSQAIRMSERVAIAMEARGFFGAAADTVSARTFYRTVAVRGRDYVYTVTVVVVAIVLLCVI